MKTRILLSAAAAAALLAACAQAPEPVAPPDTSADVDTIRANTDQFVTLWNVNDTASIAALIAEDVVLMQPAGGMQRGRDQVLATIGQSYDPATMQQSATVEEVTVSGDYAYAYGTWTLTPTEAAAEGTATLNGKWSTLSKREADGAWMMWRWMWNQDEGPPAEQEG